MNRTPIGGRKKDTFWKTAKQCAEEISKWPQWMQDITIDADTISTGQFWRDKKTNQKDEK